MRFLTVLVTSASLISLLLGACSMAPQKAALNYELIRAAEKGKTEAVKELVRRGADVHAHDGEGWTPYLAAESNGHWETMSYLRNLGAATAVGF